MGGEVAVIQIAGGLDDIQADRVHPHAADLGEELGRGLFQRDLQGGVIHRPDAQVLHGGIDVRVRDGGDVHTVQLLAAHDVAYEGGEVAAVAGIRQPAEGVHEVLGRDLHAVAPVVLPQVEGPGQTVLGSLPVLCAGGLIDLRTVLVHAGPDQALQYVGLDLDLLGRVVLVIVERVEVLRRPVDLDGLVGGQGLRSAVFGTAVAGIGVIISAAAGQQPQEHDGCQ